MNTSRKASRGWDLFVGIMAVFGVMMLVTILVITARGL